MNRSRVTKQQVAWFIAAVALLLAIVAWAGGARADDAAGVRGGRQRHCAVSCRVVAVGTDWRMTMVHLHIACNDYRNGTHTGQVESIQFFGADNVDPMLMLNGGPLRCHLWHSTKSKKPRFLRLGHIPAIRVASYTTWVGNWCWDSALVSDADAAKVANYLRKRGWHNEGGWIDIGKKWDSEEPFTEKDFQEQTV